MTPVCGRWAGNGSEDAGTSSSIAAIRGTGIIVSAVTAGLTISVTGTTPVFGTDHSNGSVHSEMRCGGVSFAEKEIEWVDVLRNHANVGFVDGQSSGHLSMDPSKINNKFVVHIHPDVIVSCKSEDFGSTVSESSVKFKAEGIVVASIIVSKTLIVDWEEKTVVIAVNVRIAIGSRSTHSVIEGDIDVDWDVPSISVIPPVRPRSAIVDYGSMFCCTVVYWFSISSQGILHNSCF